MANGNPNPKRAIEGQDTKLSRASGMHSMVVDPVHDEYFVGNSFGQAILAYRGSASGDAPPLRIIQGAHTKLASGRLDVDPQHNEIFVRGDRTILVFRREADGDEAPIRTLSGPDTQLRGGDSGIAVDPVDNLMVVGQGPSAKGGSGSLLIFNRAERDNAAPLGVISGPKTGLNSVNQIQIYPAKREIVVAMPGVGDRGPDYVPGGIVVWSLDDRGDVAPRAIIKGPASGLIRPRGVAIDPQHKEIFVADMARNALLTFYMPQIF